MRAFHGIQNYLTFWNPLKSLRGRDAVVITQVQYTQLPSYLSALTAAFPPASSLLRCLAHGPCQLPGQRGRMNEPASSLQATLPHKRSFLTQELMGCWHSQAVCCWHIWSGRWGLVSAQRNLTWEPFKVAFQAGEASGKCGSLWWNSLKLYQWFTWSINRTH